MTVSDADRPPDMPDKQNPTSSQQAVHAQPLKAVLVVDDDKQLASALEWILVDENYLVDVAFDGEEALLKVKVHEYDAIICDLQMPRLRGDEFYFQASDLRPELAERFIFITGFATDSENQDFLSQQGTKHLVKPFRINDLIGMLKELLGGNA